ncbi:hypothetical protein [Perlucidibaca piscinae]|uniref:hypothetical protein n=1 Tax=Perlucidibaca piscinae TaxID=392589 RepID=UPI0003B5962D|nr:hypothetical protein [Perlucidibaca piscinae]
MLMLQMLGTALLSSLFTVFMMRWWLRRQGQLVWQQQMDDLHESIARTVEVRVKRAVIESLSETRSEEELRDSTWRAAKSGGELLNEGLQNLLGRRRRD